MSSPAAAPAPAVVPPAADLFAKLRLMLAVEYTDHQNVVRPAIVTKIQPNGVVNLVAYGVHAGDPATDLVLGVIPNPDGGAPHRWRFYS